MQRLAIVASVPLVGIAIVAGCRGSVDRVYDDALGGEGGTVLEDAGLVDKAHFDAASLSDAAPLTAAAQVHVTVRGLSGVGLVLQDNTGDDLPVPANGAYTFSTAIPPGQPYKVTISNQPSAPSQTCAVTFGEGTAAGKDIDVSVDCTIATFGVGGTVVGLGTGNSVTLQNNHGADVVVSADGPFTFPGVQSGNNFEVTIKATSAGTICNVSGGTGTVGTAAVDSVVVNCGANTYTVGGNVTGLAGTLVITNNSGNDRTISANGSFAFSTPISKDAQYKVEVKTQPVYPPQAQVCGVTNGAGTMGVANVTNVAINCVTNKYAVGGTVNGLTAAGLKLQNNGGDDKSISAPGGSFTFATQIGSGSSYNATIITQPAGQTCTVSSPSGTVSTGAIGNIVVNCATPIPLSENFDGSSSLPSGWTSVVLNGGGVTTLPKWSVVPAPGGNTAFTSDPSHPVDVALVSPAFNVSSTTAKLTFTHTMDSEEDWDGGVLEINVAGGGWKDIIAAGGSFTSGGYNTAKLQYDGGNPLAATPRAAWSGKASGTVSANLPVSAAGKSVQLRWRFGADEDTPGPGWNVDNVVVTN